MDISTFLQSGLIEAYVLGLCTKEEILEVEMMAGKYPEVRQELTSIEITLEKFAFSQAVTPPEWMKGRIEEQVKNMPLEPKVAEFITKPTSSNPMLWGMILMGIILGLSMVYFYTQIHEKKQALIIANTALDSCRVQQQARQNSLQQQLDFILHRDTKAVLMAALPGKDASHTASVFLNPGIKTMYIDTKNLAAPPAGKDFQLWALVDGKPVSMGVVSLSGDNTWIHVDFVENAGAFAISLEPVGGSAAPTEVLMLGEVG